GRRRRGDHARAAGRHRQDPSPLSRRGGRERTRALERDRLSSKCDDALLLCFEHDLFRKPGPTPDQVRGRRFRDHALMPTRHDVTVVKLGGSYAFAPELKDWLRALARCAGHVILVPGGRAFADSVRHAQTTMAFDDDAAHHMALLAMEQFGRALAGLQPGMILAASAAAIRQAMRAHKVPVWSPTRMVLKADIPATWDVTA